MASKSKLKCEQPTRNWSELPSDLTINILQRLGAVDPLENAQKVCTALRKVCKDPAMWRVVRMEACLDDPVRRAAYKEMCKQAVDRSQGQLLDLTVRYGDYELLLFIADRSSQLRRLELVKFRHIFNEEWGEAFKKLPLLEELGFIETKIWEHNIEDVARYCPLLKTLKLNQKADRLSYGSDDDIDYILSMQDDSALAIGRHLRALTHLELIGNSMTNNGLQYILRSCCHLESLDLRRCRNMWGLREDLGKKCSQQIKNVKFPCDDLKGHPYARDVLYEPEYDSDYVSWEVYDPYDHLYDDDYTANNNDNFDNLNDVEP
ncbi:putative F-box/LRR-repeat protein 9 [Bidens hawaiensis]|uniref:putative F-box/LRR-repeat protein 9 n=1 Tax=Bidens hawaiensis TaxID=980011 RepID=UPI0040493735